VFHWGWKSPAGKQEDIEQTTDRCCRLMLTSGFLFLALVINKVIEATRYFEWGDIIRAPHTLFFSKRVSMKRLMHLMASVFIVLALFACGGGGGDDGVAAAVSGDDAVVAPVSMSVDYLQYSTYEYESLFRIFVNPENLGETDITDVKLLSPSGALIAPTNEPYFYDQSYTNGVYNDTTGVIEYSPGSYAGLAQNFDSTLSFPPGVYTVEIITKEGEILSDTINYPGKYELEPIALSSMALVENLDGSFTLSWTNPTAGIQNQSRAIFFDQDFNDILRIKLPTYLTTLTIPASLVQSAIDAREPAGIRWHMETRYYSPDGVNVASSRSDAFKLPWNDQTAPTFLGSQSVPADGSTANVNTTREIVLKFSEPMGSFTYSTSGVCGYYSVNTTSHYSTDRTEFIISLAQGEVMDDGDCTITLYGDTSFLHYISDRAGNALNEGNDVYYSFNQQSQSVPPGQCVGEVIAPLNLTIGTPLNQTIEAFGTKYYVFEVVDPATYTISLYNMATDNDWILTEYVSNCEDDYPLDPPLIAESDNLSTTPEIKAVSLNPGKYRLMVDEWNDLPSSYTVSVTR
jgi:hypothetical protein